MRAAGLRGAVAFLTPLPAGAVVPSPGTLSWFPIVGAALGLAVGGIWWAASEAFPPLVAAALVVLADVALTGALHLDGLADSADGLFAHLDGAPRRRAVMAAPDVGAFGVVAVAVTLLLRWSALASVEPAVLTVAAVWCASRAAMAVALAAGPYVGGGLGRAFLSGDRSAAARVRGPLGAGVVVGGALVAASTGGSVWWGLAGVAAGSVAVVALGHRRLGGVTGDVVGAAGLVGETVGLILVTAS